MYFLANFSSFWKSSLKEQRRMIFEVDYCHKSFSGKFRCWHIFLSFNNLPQPSFCRCTLSLAAPKSNKNRYWRVGKLEVVMGDRGPYYWIDVGQRMKGSCQTKDQLRNFMFVVCICKKNYFIFTQDKVVEKDQSQYQLLFFIFFYECP